MSAAPPWYAPGQRWQKVLYKRQPYADNHVDDSFLASLVTNANVQHYEYWSMVRAAAVIAQQIAVMVMFFVTLALINRESVSVETVAALNGCAAAVLLAWLRLAGPQFYTAALLPDVPSVLSHAGIFAAVLFVLSPILQTLTQSYADETIWAHAILLAVTHVCFHNYGSSNATASASGAFSFNAIIFASALLSSRLPSTTHVFIAVALAIAYFVLYPQLRDYIRVRSETAHLCLTLAWCASTLGLLAVTSRLLAVLFSAGMLFIVFVAPLWLLQAQAYKNEIRGPWDVASVPSRRT